MGQRHSHGVSKLFLDLMALQRSQFCPLNYHESRKMDELLSEDEIVLASPLEGERHIFPCRPLKYLIAISIADWKSSLLFKVSSIKSVKKRIPKDRIFGDYPTLYTYGFAGLKR